MKNSTAKKLKKTALMLFSLARFFSGVAAYADDSSGIALDIRTPTGEMASVETYVVENKEGLRAVVQTMENSLSAETVDETVVVDGDASLNESAEEVSGIFRTSLRRVQKAQETTEILKEKFSDWYSANQDKIVLTLKRTRNSAIAGAISIIVSRDLPEAVTIGALFGIMSGYIQWNSKAVRHFISSHEREGMHPLVKDGISFLKYWTIGIRFLGTAAALSYVVFGSLPGSSLIAEYLGAAHGTIGNSLMSILITTFWATSGQWAWERFLQIRHSARVAADPSNERAITYETDRDTKTSSAYAVFSEVLDGTAGGWIGKLVLGMYATTGMYQLREFRQSQKAASCEEALKKGPSIVERLAMVFRGRAQ